MDSDLEYLKTIARIRRDFAKSVPGDYATGLADAWDQMLKEIEMVACAQLDRKTAESTKALDTPQI